MENSNGLASPVANTASSRYAKVYRCKQKQQMSQLQEERSVLSSECMKSLKELESLTAAKHELWDELWTYVLMVSKRFGDKNEYLKSILCGIDKLLTRYGTSTPEFVDVYYAEISSVRSALLACIQSGNTCDENSPCYSCGSPIFSMDLPSIHTSTCSMDPSSPDALSDFAEPVPLSADAFCNSSPSCFAPSKKSKIDLDDMFVDKQSCCSAWRELELYLINHSCDYY